MILYIQMIRIPNKEQNKYMSKDYTSTLNLPQTDFPMRASLPQHEPEILDNWNREDIYHKIIENNADKPTFILHDGPPYANGNIHIGTSLNKILKDIIVKYKNMSGWCSPYVPGWDCHGLPAENAIIKQTKLDRKKMSIPEFRDKCHKFVLDYVDIQRSQFKRLGVLADWDNPYLTVKPSFESKQIEIFGEMAKKGYIYRDFKSVYWCPDDETALAEAEIEYSDDKCESIYVKFKVDCDRGKLSGLCDLDKTYFVIWTTTTWTLPGNLAICLNADFDYVLIKVQCGETYIIASQLLEQVCKTAKIENYEIIAKLKGSDFELMTANHPFLDRKSVILNGEHVTNESGTGCVHTAPGHGSDDFDICRKYDTEKGTSIGVVVPVDGRGFLTEEAGKFAGIRYDKANKIILDDLRENGFLLASEEIVHSYPHCWRCKNPIIYRATEQWFASVSALKEAAVKACDDIKWYPKWGRERMTAMIVERNDWCISRQRNWGVPIPIFYCTDCGEYLINDSTISAVSDLFRREGSNSWFLYDAEQILPPETVCKCGCGKFRKETDIMDVWFDSGSSHAAVLDQTPGLKFPADIYLEGGDQYRGWFQSSMLTSIAAKGVAPYKTIITHGWTVDGEGKAMHKSLGNAVAPEDVIKDWGADILRLWVSSVDYTNDVKISKEILKQLSEVYRKIRNTLRILLANLNGFNPDTDTIPAADLYDIDKWALSKLTKLIKSVREGYENYEFHYIYHDINNFCTIDMSKLYIDIIKDRVYVEQKDSLARRSAQTAMYEILKSITLLIAPLLAYTSEEVWSYIPKKESDKNLSVFLNDIPDYNAEFDFSELETKWNRLFELRDDVLVALEESRTKKIIGKSLEAQVTITTSDKEIFGLLSDFGTEELETVFITSAVNIVFEENAEKFKAEVCTASGKKCVRCWKQSDEGIIHEEEFVCSRCASVINLK